MHPDRGEHPPAAGLESSSKDDATKGVDEALLGRRVVERRLISPEQLQQCLDEQRRAQGGDRLTLGQLLVQRNLVRIDQLLAVVSDQQTRAAAVPELARY